jgi:hypothetical protein
MARLISASERILKARALIQKARDLPAGDLVGDAYFSYIAQVKDLIQKARDLVKFIPYTPTATPEMKTEVAELFKEADATLQEILHR